MNRKSKTIFVWTDMVVPFDIVSVVACWCIPVEVYREKNKQECHPTGCLVNQSRGQDGNQFCPVQFTSAVWSALDIRKKQGHNSQVSYWPDQHQKTRRTPYLGMLLRRQPFVWCTVSGLKQNKFLSQHIWDPCERSQSHHFLHVLCNGKSHRMVKP